MAKTVIAKINGKGLPAEEVAALLSAIAAPYMRSGRSTIKVRTLATGELSVYNDGWRDPEFYG